MSGYVEYALLTASSLFAIVNPFGVVPAFLSMTPNDSPEQRLKTARMAALTATGTLLVFAYAGLWIFRLLGITMPAFQLAASVVLLLIALDMLRAQQSRVQGTHEDTSAGIEKTDIAITPLALPMLAGPGAITTAILLQRQAATSLPHNIILCASIIAVGLATYAILRLSVRGAAWLNPIALRIGNRIMGLLLAALAFQFGLNAIMEFRATLKP
jgi:multiple antibiotic resistance protein